MTVSNDIVTLLQANATLVSLATGGIVTYDDLGGNALTYTSYPAGFDSNHRLKYVIAVRERQRLATNSVTWEFRQQHSYSQALEVGFFAGKHLSFDVLEQMQSIVYGLLQNTRLADRGRIEWRNDGGIDRAYALNNDFAIFSIYDLLGVRTPGYY